MALDPLSLLACQLITPDAGTADGPMAKQSSLLPCMLSLQAVPWRLKQAGELQGACVTACQGEQTGAWCITAKLFAESTCRHRC